METQFQLQPSSTTAGVGGAVNSAARPLLMPPASSPSHHHNHHNHHHHSPTTTTSMHHSPNSNGRGSIPAYFPETFKDFFSMLTEDEDHNEAITNLLEDKVIPRSPKRGGSGNSSANDSPRKRCEKPFCCHNSSSANGGCGGNGGNGNTSGGYYLDSPAYSGGGLTRTLSSKYYRRRPSQHRLLPENAAPGSSLLDSAVGSSTSTGSSVTSLNSNNFGRSNSFRLHRNVPSAGAATYSSYLSYYPVGGGGAAAATGGNVDRPLSNINSSNNSQNHLTTCKHVQYCCLHLRDEENPHPPASQSFQPSTNSSSSTLSLNERGTGRLLPFSPMGTLLPNPGQRGINHHHHHQQQQQQIQQQQQQLLHTQDGINFSDDEKKSLIYPQLTSDRYMKGIDCEGGGGGGGFNNGDTFEQHKQRYSLLTKSYDQINRSRIFESSTKSRRSSCDTPDQQQQQPLPQHSGTDQATVTSSISTTTTSVGDCDDDFDSPSTIKYKLIANVAGQPPLLPGQRTNTTTGAGGGGNSSQAGAAKSQVNIITNPLVRQYPFETSYKNKKMYANETIVTHQPGGNLKTISYGPSGGSSGGGGTAGGATSAGQGIDMKKSPLVNRRRSSSVTLPQPPITGDYRYIKGMAGENHNNIFDGGGGDCRISRDRYQSAKSGGSNTMMSGVNDNANQSQKQKQQQQQQQQQSKGGNQSHQTQQQQRFGKQRQRMRTASMPSENRKPRLAEMRRSAIHCADVDIEYYRLRSFSITSHGICNLGDSMRSRRSRSINSVTSTGTSNSGRDRNNSNASQTMNELNDEAATTEGGVGGGSGGSGAGNSGIPAYKVAMLGSSGVGKTALTYQFTTSEYICAYDLSLDDDYGQKTVSVLLNGQETDLEVVDHPACEMSTEAFCATYNIDIFVVVYSIVDRKSFKAAERVLQYLRDNDCLLTRGAILVGNKTDLERQREVPVQVGKKLAKEINVKFIETSSGLDHNVDELLVGIVAQVKLNPQRVSRLTDKQRLMLACQQQAGAHFGPNKFAHSAAAATAGDSGGEATTATGKNGKLARKRQGGHSTGPLNSLDLHSLKHSVMTKQGKRKAKGASPRPNPSGEDLKEEDEDNKSTSSSTSSSSASLCSSGSLKSSRSTGSLDREMSHFKSRLGSASCSTNSTPIKRPTGHHHHRQHRGSDGGHRRAATDGEMDDIRRQQQEEEEENQAGGSGVGRGGGSGPGGGKSSSKSAKSSPVKFTNRTKMFLTSFLKFRKSLRMRRRSSSSCSDFFVI